jgi:hypothetical protein
MGEFTIAPGDLGRIGYDCKNYCNEGAVRVVGSTGGPTYAAGRTDYPRYGWTIPEEWLGTPPFSCASYTCSFWPYQYDITGWSTDWTADGVSNNFPQSGLLPEGTYAIYQYDMFGDGSETDTISLQTVAISHIPDSWINRAALTA